MLRADEIEVRATSGIAGHPPDIWLFVGTDTYVRLSIAEAFELAFRLQVEAAEAVKFDREPKL
jgi:hypothetical protein